ncbi:MAG TPA: hypothetical protein VJN96_09095 [Vicinamibacterales bacterium]|nr:hypothetical protein [Vicinamibacterales bacterium]
MSDELAIAAERFRQQVAARDAPLDAALAPIRNSGALVGTGLALGDRVYDTVSGLEGVVIDGTRENVVVPATK